MWRSPNPTRLKTQAWLFLWLVICLVQTHVLAFQPHNPQAPREKQSNPAQSNRTITIPESIRELPGTSKRYALIIGVDTYKDAQINSLNGAANDARALATALTKYGNFPSDQVVLLTTDQPDDRQPTRTNILRRLSTLISNVPKDGLLLVSFAGHGIERNHQAYLLPSDAIISDDVSLLEDTALNVARTVKERIEVSGISQVIILLDACRNDPISGRGEQDNRLSDAYTRGFNFELKNQGIEAFAVLYATSRGQRAYEFSEKKQGYFSWAFVEGIKGEAANEQGEITLAGLKRYVEQTVSKRTRLDLGATRIQEPLSEIKGFKAEELIIAKIPVQPKPPTVSTSTASSSPPTTQPASASTSTPGQFHPLAIEALGKVRLKDFDGAISDLTYAIKLDPTNATRYKLDLAEVYGKRGYDRFQQADYERAVKDFSKSLEFNPLSAGTYTDRGTARFYVQDFKGAISDFSKAIEFEPNFIRAYTNRAIAYRQTGQNGKAEADEKMIKQLNAESGLASPSKNKDEIRQQVMQLVTDGHAKMIKRDFDGAIQAFSKALDLDPKFHTANILRGNARLGKQYYVGFITDLVTAVENGTSAIDKTVFPQLLDTTNQAISTDPKNAWLYQLRAMLYHGKRDFNSAITDLDRCIELNPTDDGSYTLRGMLLLEKDKKKARQDCETAFKLNPKNELAQFIRFNGNEADLETAMADLADGDLFRLMLKRMKILTSTRTQELFPWMK